MDPDIVEGQPLGLQRETRVEMLDRLNFERQVLNNKTSMRKIHAQTILSIIGIICLIAVAVKFVFALFTINLI